MADDGDDEAKPTPGRGFSSTTAYQQPSRKNSTLVSIKHRVFPGMLNFRMVYILIFSDSRDDIEIHDIYVSHPLSTSPAATPP